MAQRRRAGEKQSDDIVCPLPKKREGAHRSTVCPFKLWELRMGICVFGTLYGNDEQNQRTDESRHDRKNFVFGRLARAEKRNQRENDDHTARDALSFLFSLSDILCYRKE